jgi:hypothetical protein
VVRRRRENRRSLRRRLRIRHQLRPKLLLDDAVVIGKGGFVTSLLTGT